MIFAAFFELCKMITVAARRLHVAVQISSRLDLLDFIRSVVAGLLNNCRRPAFSRPSGRRIKEQQFWPAPPCQCRESRALCKMQKEHCKKCQDCGVRLHMCFLDYHK